MSWREIWVYHYTSPIASPTGFLMYNLWFPFDENKHPMLNLLLQSAWNKMAGEMTGNNEPLSDVQKSNPETHKPIEAQRPHGTHKRCISQCRHGELVWGKNLHLQKDLFDSFSEKKIKLDSLSSSGIKNKKSTKCLENLIWKRSEGVGLGNWFKN